jgi:UDP-N-acetyl-D-glucosamine dehydrogenase
MDERAFEEKNSLNAYEALLEKIVRREAVAGVVGLGYVGLPLAVEFGKAGLQVMGFDVDGGKVAEVNAGRSYIPDVPEAEVAALTGAGRLAATTDFERLREADTVNICVPTPLGKTKDPDIRRVLAATEAVAKALRPGMLVVLESTTYPGTTEEVLLPLLERSGLRCGVDFFLCFSPERVDPGNERYQTRNIPKVVGGVTKACSEMGQHFYEQSLEKVVPVSSTRVAETVKLLENTFRMINIGMVNELAMMCDRMGIDVWEVIDAAATKPFGFMPFYPGPGLGGHCIPIDPFYLSWKSRQAGFEARFIELAGAVNGQMPGFVVGKVQDLLNDQGLPVRGSRVHVLGVAYKRDIGDIRESPALDVLHELRRRGAVVSFSDAYVDRVQEDGLDLTVLGVDEGCREADCVVVVTDHSGVNYGRVLELSRVVLDTRNAMKGMASEKLARL